MLFVIISIIIFIGPNVSSCNVTEKEFGDWTGKYFHGPANSSWVPLSSQRQLGKSPWDISSMKICSNCQESLQTSWLESSWMDDPVIETYINRPFWNLNLGDVKYFCVNQLAPKCPEIDGHQNWEGIPGTGDRVWVAIHEILDVNRTHDQVWKVWFEGCLVFCAARNIKMCYKISRWRHLEGKENILWSKPVEVDKVEHFKIQVEETVLICEAVNPIFCSKVRGSPWFHLKQFTNDSLENASLVVELEKAKVYCTGTERNCKTLVHGRWRQRRPPRPTETKFGGEYMKKVGDVLMVCRTKNNVHSCPKIKGKGTWGYVKYFLGDVASIPPSLLHGSGFYLEESKNKDTILYCSGTRNECTTVHQGDWQPLPDAKEGSSHWWDVEVDGHKIVCAAKFKDECAKIEGSGDWDLMKNNTNEDDIPPGSRWMKRVNKAKMYCSGHQDMCQKIYGHLKWERDEGGIGFKRLRWWERKTGVVKLICVVRHKRDCPEIRGGGIWSIKKHGKENEPSSPWTIIVDPMKKTMIYCSGRKDNCEKAYGEGKWFNNPYTKKPGPWEIKIGGIILTCVGNTKVACPRIAGGSKWWQSKRESIPQRCHWVMVVNTKTTLYCTGSLLKCRKTRGKGKWLLNPWHNGGHHNWWGNKVHGATVVCAANRLNQCPTIKGAGKWIRKKYPKKKTPGTPWAIIVDPSKNTRLFCSGNQNTCERIHGHGKWIPNPKPNQEGHLWEQKVGEGIIACAAKKKAACPKVAGGGGWMMSERTDAHLQSPWIAVVDGATLFCTKSLNGCRETMDHGDWVSNPWEKKESGESKYWELKVGVVILTCVEKNMVDCPKIGEKGEWTTSKHRKNDPETWSTVIRSKKIYCTGKLNECGNVRIDDTWQMVRGTKKEEDRHFELGTPKVKFICVSTSINNCPPIGGKRTWKQLQEGADEYAIPPGSTIVVKLEWALIFCIRRSELCINQLKTEDWTDVAGEEIWETKRGQVKLYCVRKSRVQCPKIKGDGTWIYKGRLLDEQDYPELQNGWVVIVAPNKSKKGRIILHCNGPKNQCKKIISGGKWIRTEGHKPSPIQTGEDIYITHATNATIICRCNQEKTCPIIEGRNDGWSENLKDLDTFGEGRYEQKVWDKTLVCFAKNKKYCPKTAGHKDWVSAPKQESSGEGKYVTRVFDAVLICGANNKHICPQNVKGSEGWSKPDNPIRMSGFGSWTQKVGDVVVVCGAMFKDQCPHIKKQGDEWVPSPIPHLSGSGTYVTRVEEAIVVCRAENPKQCPHMKGQLEKWFKQGSNIDTCGAGRFETQVGNEELICYARNKEECPTVRGEGKGYWEETPKQDSSGTGQYVIVSGETVLVCQEANVNLCPKNTNSGDWTKSETPVDTSGFGKFEQKVQDTVVNCLAMFKDQCPKIDGGGNHWVPSPIPDKSGEGLYVAHGVGGATIVCRAKDRKYCPRLAGGSEWTTSTSDLDAFGAGRYEMKVGDHTVVCVANNVKDCPNVKGHSVWNPSPKQDSSGDGVYVTQVGDAIITCGAANGIKCPRNISGSDGWSTPKTPLDTSGCGRFTQKLEDQVLVCLAMFKDQCPSTKAGGNEWVPSPMPLTTGGGQYITKIGGVIVVCGAKNKKRCPPLKGRREGWLKQETHLETFGASRYESIVGRVTMVCFAGNKDDCPVVKGHGKSQWDKKPKQDSCGTGHHISIVGDTLLICAADSKAMCPKLNKGGEWTKPETPISTSGFGKYRQNVRDTIIYCLGMLKDNCPHIHGGKGNWVPAKTSHTYGEGTYISKVNNAVVFCEAVVGGDCPIIEGSNDGWSENLKDLDTFGEGRYEQNVWDKTVVCFAKNKKFCPKTAGHKDWVSAPKQESSGEGKYVTRVFDAVLICGANNKHICPQNVKGSEGWSKPDNPIRMSGFGSWTQKVGDVVVVCGAMFKDQCPHIKKQGDEWVPSPIPHLSGSGTYVTRVEEAIVVCRAENPKRCPHLKGQLEKWFKQESNIDTCGAGRFETQVGNEKLICFARNKEECPTVRGEGKGYWEETPKQDSSGTGQYVIVSGETVLVCQEANVNLCPKNTNSGDWTKSETPVDTSGFGKFEQKVEDTVVNCLAMFKDQCPKIDGGGNHWVPSPIPDKSGEGMYVAHGVGGATIVCRAKGRKYCPLLAGGSEWTTSTSDLDAFGAGRYEMKVGDHTVVCVAKNVKDCPKVKGHGVWNQSPKQDSSGDGVYVTQVGDAIITCGAANGIKCPRNISGSDGWSTPKTPLDTSGCGRFTQKLEDQIVVCLAMFKDQCPPTKAGGNEWIPSPMPTTTGSGQYITKIGGVIVVCGTNNKNRCPLLKGRREGWLKQENHLETFGAGRYESIVGSVTIVCFAGIKDDCPVMKGHGKSQWDEKPKQDSCGTGHYVSIVGDNVLICEAESNARCPEVIEGGGWTKPETPISTSGYGRYQTMVGDIIIYCLGMFQADCPNMGHGSIVWVPSHRPNDGGGGRREQLAPIEPSGRGVYEINYGKSIVICDAEKASQCPKLSGLQWNKRKTALVVGEGHTKFLMEFNGVIIICIAKCKCDCPNIRKFECNDVQWSVVLYLYYKITVDERTFICESDDVSNCPDIRGKNHWNQMCIQCNQLPPQLRFVSITLKIRVYCDGDDVSSCSAYDGSFVRLPPAQSVNVHLGTLPVIHRFSWWVKRLYSITVTCISRFVATCPFIIGGTLVYEYHRPPNWHQLLPTNAKWIMHLLPHVLLVCDAEDVIYCPHPIGFKRWVMIKKTLYVWKVKIKRMWFVCKSIDVGYCPTISVDKSWKMIKVVDNPKEIPDGSKWVFDDSYAIVWCSAHKIEYCVKWLDISWERIKGLKKPEQRRPKITGGWFTKKNRMRSPEGVVLVILTCIAHKKSKCPSVTGGGPWKKIKSVRRSQDIPEDTFWIVVIDKIMLACNSKWKNLCPPIVTTDGSSIDWRKISHIKDEMSRRRSIHNRDSNEGNSHHRHKHRGKHKHHHHKRYKRKSHPRALESRS